MNPPLHLLRAEIRAERPYRVPTQSDALAKLDQNESPFDVPEALKRAAVARLLAADWNRYPDDRPLALQVALAARLGLPAEGLLVGRGSNEIVYTVGLALLDRGTPVVLPHPMFALYESVARMYAARVVPVGPGASFAHDADDVLEAARASGAALTVVTTPNNPTGQTIPYEGLERLAAGVPGFLLVDEAYVEFVEGPTAVELIGRFPNVLVMRTFSKAMGLAGLRLGFLAGDPAVIQELEKARLPFLVDRFSEAVGLALLERPDLVAERVAVLKAERERLLGALVDVDGVEAVPSAGNFFLLRTPLAPSELVRRLSARGVRARNMAGYAALGPDEGGRGWVRVTVGAPSENRAFEAALHETLASADTPAPVGAA